jgi:hypothetical protein
MGYSVLKEQFSEALEGVYSRTVNVHGEHETLQVFQNEKEALVQFFRKYKNTGI